MQYPLIQYFFSFQCEEIKKEYQSRLVTVYDTPCEVVLNSDVIFSCVSDSIAAGEVSDALFIF